MSDAGPRGGGDGGLAGPDGGLRVPAADPFSDESNVLVGSKIIVKLEQFGWCIGTLTEKNTNRRRKINGKMVNFIAKFDMDGDETTDLSLEVTEYDTSAFAEYESWLLLEPLVEMEPMVEAAE